MDYNTLMEKYRTQEAFIYGRSVMQIVETRTYEEDGVTKTDFIYKTERQNRGVITVAH